MKRVTIFCFLVLAGFAGIANSQDILVEFVDGYVEYQADGEWVDVFIGDMIPQAAAIRLDDQSWVELRGAGDSVLLSRAGTYQLDSVLQTTRRNQSAGVGGMARGRLRNMVRDGEVTDVTVAGVRASEAVSRSDVAWAGGDSVADLIEEGILALDDEDAEGAYYLFEDAYEIASSREVDVARFYLGYAAYMMGNMGEAFVHLDNVDVNPEADFYHDHVLLLGQLLVESFAYTDAQELLQDYVTNGDPAPEDLQVAHVLQGLAFSGSGDTARAAQHLQMALALDPDSENGRLAASMMDSL